MTTSGSSGSTVKNYWLGAGRQIDAGIHVSGSVSSINCFSDFGLSPSRPLLWWLSGIIFFATIYLGYYSGTDAWLPYHLETGAWFHSECVKGTGRPWAAALGLSLHNSLPALSGIGDKLAEFYACLYGADSENSLRPVIPYIVSFLGVPQVVFSTAMIFLFLLAVRNHFKIK